MSPCCSRRHLNASPACRRENASRTLRSSRDCPDAGTRLPDDRFRGGIRALRGWPATCSRPMAVMLRRARGGRHERSRGRADHRRRRVRRGGGLEPRRNEDAHPLPRTRRLDEPGDLSEHRPRLGGALLRRLFPEPQHPRPARGLPDQRRQLADQGRQLQRRRRRHGDVHGAFAAPASLRLPGEDARRRRRGLADRLRHAGAVLRGERPDDGGLRPRRRSRRAAAQPADAAAAARPLRRAAGRGDEPARLALVAVRHDGRDGRLRGPGALHQSRPLHPRLRPGRQGEHRHHLLARGAARRRRVAHPLPGARDHHRRARHGSGRRLLRRGRQGAVPGGACRRARLQRCRHAAAAAEFGLRPVPERPRQFQRPGRQEPDVPPLCPGLRLCRRADRQQPGAADLPVEQGVLRNRPVARLRARLHLPVRPRRRADHGGRRERGEGHPALGRRAITPPSAASTATASACRRSARTCPRSTTA